LEFRAYNWIETHIVDAVRLDSTQKHHFGHLESKPTKELVRMTGATLDQLEKERSFHKEMVGILDNTIAETKAAQKKFLSGGGSKVSIPKSPAKAKARKTAKAKPGRPAGSKVNKSEKIREVFRSTPTAKNKEVVAKLGDQGIEVTDGLVSIIKKKFFADKGKPAKKTRAKKGGRTASAKKTASKKQPRGDLKVIIKKILGKPSHKQGLKLADLTEEIVKAGYKTTSKKGRDGLPQIVYQTLRIMQEGKMVVHNRKSHRYRLKRSRAA